MIVVIVKDSLIYQQVATVFRDFRPDEWRVIAIEPDARNFDAPVDTTYLDIDWSNVEDVDRYEPPDRHWPFITRYEEAVAALHHDDVRYDCIPFYHWNAIYSGADALAKELDEGVHADDTLATWNERLWYNEVTANVCGGRVICMERGPIVGTFIVDGTGLDDGRNDFQQHVWPRWAEKAFTCLDSHAIEEWLDRYESSRQTLEGQECWVGPDTLRHSLQGAHRVDPLVFAPLQVPLDTNVVFRGASNERLMDFVGGNAGVQSLVKRHPGDKWTRDKWLESNCDRLGIGLRDDNVISLIGAADCVVTMNSQVGIEALIRGKPVGVLADAYWSGCGVTLDHPNAVDDVLRFAPDQQSILRFLYALVFDYLCSPQHIPSRVEEIKRRW